MRVMRHRKRAIVSRTIAATFTFIRPRAERMGCKRRFWGMEEQNEKDRLGSIARGLVRRRGRRADRHQGIVTDRGYLRFDAIRACRSPSAARRRCAEREEYQRSQRSPEQGKPGAR